MSRTTSPEPPLPPLPPRPPADWPGRLIAVALVALVGASFASLDLRWAEFLGPDALGRMARFIASFFPAQLAPGFVRKTAEAALETLAMSLLGTLLAALAGAVLALPASQRSRRWRARGVRGLARAALNALRAVPELVWASLLLVLAGLGPLPGTLALALHTSGVLGRLFADSLENVDPGPAAALQWRGASRVQRLGWALLPQVAPQWWAYTLYRWENNIRAATVLGVVGAGGLGQMLSYHLALFQMPESCTVLAAMIGLVLGVDTLSVATRRWMAR